ncbi:MAG: hypothetical protein HOP12_00325, partial [Candidatus Eisenbacteria bacterium]|nr:hypothetical protein [Candidatus Eisenbacteria bacterium]
YAHASDVFGLNVHMSYAAWGLAVVPVEFAIVFEVVHEASGDSQCVHARTGTPMQVWRDAVRS